MSTCAQERSAKAARAECRPSVERAAISDSGNDIIFEVIDADPQEPGRLMPLPEDVLSEEGAEGRPAQQEEGPEIQHRDEEDANASSAKVMGVCQPHYDIDDRRL